MIESKDLIPGNWYRDKEWKITIAARFKSFENGIFCGNEVISHENGKIKHSFSNTIWNAFPYAEVSLHEIKQYLPVGHSNHFQLHAFPEIGQCKHVSIQFFKFLESKFNYLATSSPNLELFDGYAWAGNAFWRSYKDTVHKVYTIEQLKPFINQKQEQNEQQSHALPGITSEIPRGSRSGTIAIRCRGQQASTRSRPVGNKTYAQVGRTIVVGFKISKNVIFKGNYR